MTNETVDRAGTSRRAGHGPTPGLSVSSPEFAHTVDFGRDVYCILGLPFDALTLDEATARVRHAALTNSPCFVSTPNVNFVVAARADRSFRASVLHSDLSLADGMPIVWIARLVGVPIRQRVAGADLFDRLRAQQGRPPLATYFFGGPDGVAETASRHLNAASGGLCGAGGESPGAGTAEELSRPESLARINASRARLLVVALGAKKGQAWIERNRAALRVPVVSHLGAVVNFVGGGLRRAPAWARRLGVEWAWRIAGEPTLWRRYWTDGWALTGMLFAWVLPAMWHMRGPRPPAGQADLTIDETAARWRLTLRGTWRADDAMTLRVALSRAAASDKPVEVILEADAHVDLGIAALLLLLEGFRSQRAAMLTITAHNAATARLLGLCGLALSDAADTRLARNA